MDVTRAQRTLRVSTRSIALAIAGLGVTFLGLRMLSGAERVIGWITAAAAIAMLLSPITERLARRMPHGLAVLLVALGLLAFAGVAGYGITTSLVRQYEALAEAAPRYAQQAESSKRFGQFARDAKAVERTQRFVDALPERLRGGDPADAVRAAATRGVAFVATGILSLFFLLHGRRILLGAAAQLPANRREVVTRIGRVALRRATGYALATLGEAIIAGLAAYAAARAIGAPGAAPLGMWVALWDIVPVVGAFVGALPIVAIAAAINARHAAVAILFFVVYQGVETLLVQRRIERRTMRLGPFLTTLAGAAGLEAYGLGGALVAFLAMALLVAVLLEAGTQIAEEAEADELGHAEDEQLVISDDEGIPPSDAPPTPAPAT
jgi:predicted PurR-regulated permease PerM